MRSNHLKRWSRMAGLCLALACPLAHGGPAGDWPMLDGAGQDPVCTQALKLAQTQFRSPAFRLYGPPSLPAGFPSELLASPPSDDPNLLYQNPNGWQIDRQTFDALSTYDNDNRTPGIYWQKAAAGRRLVLVDRPLSWQGDIYQAFSVPAGLSQAELSARLSRQLPDAMLALAVERAWLAPIILRDRASGRVWFVDVGAPDSIPGNWRIRTMPDESAPPRCHILFGPPYAQIRQRLPALGQFLEALDRAPGSDKGEVADHPGTRQQILFNQSVFNTLLRPWVPLQPPGNDRDHIDAGLERWARMRPDNMAILRRIQQTYPQAVRSLGDYYRRQLRMPALQAAQQAASAIDNLYRNRFAFLRG